MAIRVAINGFGRVGRAFFRATRRRNDLEVVAINDLAAAPVLAHLLKYDSVHGRFPGEARAEGDRLVVDGCAIPTFRAGRPRDLDWRGLGVWAAVDATGCHCGCADLQGHLDAGACKAVLTANPALADKETIKTIVLGVNEREYDPAAHHLVSNASCTTNALAPVLLALDAEFGVRQGVVATVHSYTQDQRLVDAPHADLARARAAALSIIPTTTGAAAALALVLPELAPRLRGLSLRVPTPNVSLVDLTVLLRAPADAAAVNDCLRRQAAGRLRGILEICDEPLVSCDFLGAAASAVLDAPRTLIAADPDGGGTLVKLLLWYDNETGYAARLADLIHFLSLREKEPSHGDQVS
jgi:glyceraldehyde 3-phosphate dehydrogenase